MGPFRAPGCPEGAQYQIKVCDDHESNKEGRVGTKSGPLGPTEDLQGPQESLIGAVNQICSNLQKG